MEDIEEQMEKLREPVEELREELSQTARDRDQWVQLASEYAAAYYYERTYRLIFGSQLDVLRDLCSRPYGATADELDIYYRQHLGAARAISPGYTMSRERFFNFLVITELVDFRSYDGRYSITEWGRGLLAYMTLAIMPQYKAY